MRRWSCLAALPYLVSPAHGAGLGPSSGEPAAPAASERAGSYIHWLEERSMLQQARVLARHYSGNSIQWQHPYGAPQPHAAVARASVWFTAYPASTIAASPGTSVISTLAEERLWSAFQAIGIQGIHTGPMKRSGGVRDLGYTPSIDGNFDRISFEIDPAFGTEAQYKAMVAAARSHGAIVIGDAVHELGVLGDGMLRLDANGLLGIERDPTGRVWWAGHPLSLTANQLIADMVRKLDGFTFEELALPLDVMREMSRGGPDLSYDFVTRPAYDPALLTGDAEFLRLVFQLMREYRIDPGRLIHALQNHDELTMGISHFAVHADETFPFRGGRLTGKELRELVRREMYERLLGERAPYNLKFGEGVASTTATVVAATLGIRDLGALKPGDVERIRRLHLLLAFYNAMQPGVFALSGWDLVGALTLPAASVRERLADGDTRWINRGAYDLLGSNPQASQSAGGLPRAVALYGSLSEQLQSSDSFASRLARLIRARAQLHLQSARLADVPAVQAKGLFVLVHELPDNTGLEITAINFGDRAIDESVPIRGAATGSKAIDVLEPQAPPLDLGSDGRLQLRLNAFAAKALRIKGPVSP